MESRWFIPKGKKLEETRIEEREHSLHVTKDTWEKITGHLDKKRLLEEAFNAEEEKKKAMHEGSKAMTRNWENSVENMRLKKEQSQLIGQQIDKNYARFMELKQEQADERRIYIEKMRERMIQRKDYPKALTSAFVYSEVLYERGKQIELKKKIEDVNKSIEDRYVDAMNKDVENYLCEQNAENMKRHEKHKKYAEELRCQVKNIQEANARAKVKLLEEENIERGRATRVIEDIARCEREKLLATRAQITKDLNESRDYKQKHEEVVRKEEAEIESIIKIIDKSKTRIVCVKKAKENEEIENKRKRCNMIGDSVRKGEAERDQKEEAIRLKAIEEENQKVEDRAKRDIEHKERMKKETIENWEAHKKEQEEKDNKASAIRKWEMLNRFKYNESDVHYNKALLRKRKEIDLQAAKDLDKQIEDNKIFRKAEKEKEIPEFDATKEQEENEEFLKYAEEVTNNAQSRGRNLIPILRVINNFKRDRMPDKKSSDLHGHLNRCQNPEHKDMLNFNPGKMAHKPESDPNYKQKDLRGS